MDAGNAGRRQGQNVGGQRARNPGYGRRPDGQNEGGQHGQHAGNARRPQGQNEGGQRARYAGHGWRPEGQNEGGQHGQHAGNAIRPQGQNEGGQRARNAGHGRRPEGQNEGGQHGQHAGNAGRPQGQNEGGQRARNAGHGRRPEGQNEGGQHGQHAGNARRPQGQNEGGQRARNAGHGRGPEGQNEGGQHGQHAGNARRPQGQNEGGQRARNAGNARRPQGQNEGGQRARNAGAKQQLGLNRAFHHIATENIRKNNGDEPKNIISFTTLENISKAEVSDIFTKLSDKQIFFTNLLQSRITKTDLFPLIMKITFKVIQSPYKQLIQKYVLEMCNPNFIQSLQLYLMNLPYTENKSQNNLYWKDQDQFWENFVVFCDCLVASSPSTALKFCKSLIESTSRTCLEDLKNKHGYTKSDDYEDRLQTIRNQLTISEKKIEVQHEHKRGLEVNEPPPDDFRLLSPMPDRNLLLELQPYLRPNHVKGAYQDVDHYLDVQFRLLREDCFRPLRKGLLEYLAEPRKKKYENVRIFHGIKFALPYVNKQRIGSIIQFGEHDTKRFKKFKWEHNKRFIFGSLLLLSKDNFNNFIVATILDRDPKLLANGQIPVTLINSYLSNKELYNEDEYILAESTVYFEPYLHVMRALQDPQLPTALPMQKYIVQVDMQARPPAYLNEEVKYSVGKYEFRVREAWPSAPQLGLDESQHGAFRHALTHEFSVIQGPPGTGKTFIGVLIAKTLLCNLSQQGPLILLICYTNHALDQFLKAIMQITPNVARIGGQSKDKGLGAVNLSALRKGHHCSLFWDNKRALTSVVRDIQCLISEIEAVNDGIVSYKNLKYLPEVEVLAKQSKTVGDCIEYWLFENAHQFVNIQDVDYNENIAEQSENAEEQDDLNFGREDINLDDFGFDTAQNSTEINLSFTVKDAQNALRTLDALLAHTRDPNKREQIERNIHCLLCKIKLLKEMKENQPRLRIPNITDEVQVYQLDMHQRWALYLKWERLKIRKYESEIKHLNEELTNAQESYDEARMVADADILRSRKVIGITTSGAARLRKLLISLATPIVIVEEAAEVLEQHIVSSLTPHCKHLILIGDHQQLRPSASSLQLARDYDIEVSLFERMIMNDVDNCRLSVQHRMRPQLARLISPHIYPNLLNHESVETFPDVRGLTNNLFFFTHDYKETTTGDSTSRENHREAELVLSAANYIMQQDYRPEDLTILAAYAGQLFYMRKQRVHYRFLANVKITVVDNYQGEESKIILLSLVRNNDNNQIGFLGTANRICVALSRAREGFYIFGNIDILKRNSELWTAIADTLESSQSLGSSLILRCESHRDQLTQVSKVEDFNKCPEGGCLLKCNFDLPCGHQCDLICHGYDRNHQNGTCKSDCDRILCEFNHKCPLKCAVPCAPCKVLMDRTFACGHVNKVKCYELDDPLLKCNTKVTKELPCKHETTEKCYMEPEDIICPVKCDARLNCGHMCRSLCHHFKDPTHEKYLCEAVCGRNKAGCSAGEDASAPHLCRNRCHEPCDPCTLEVKKKRSQCTHKASVKCNEDVNKKPCNENCAKILPCGHHCKQKCWETCGDCKQKVSKTIPDCGHLVETTCDKEVTRKDCKGKCKRQLSCGHPCPDVCSQKCDPAKCTELITSKTYDSPCGHKVNLPCNVYHQVQEDAAGAARAALRACGAACGAELRCGHACAGVCGTCVQGRLHQACAQPCNNYNICGHLCKEPCKEICPPCREPCEVKCAHSKCKKRCGEPCEPCKEQCARACVHAACTRACAAPCSVAACARACELRLECGHACRGLCGEPCPPVCAVCRPEDFPTDFLGDAYDDHDKFVLLEDCGHVLELDNMENLMRGDRDDIKIRDCPFCRKPIINTQRYKDVVNDMFKTQINPIKQKIYGSAADINNKKEELLAKFVLFDEKYMESCLQSSTTMSYLYTQLRRRANNCKGMHLLQLSMLIVCLDILEMITECNQNYSELTNKNKELQIAFEDVVHMICKVIIANHSKLSSQMQNDIIHEIKRLNAITQLQKVFNLPAYAYNRKTPEVATQTKAAMESVLDWKKFNEEVTFKTLDSLQHAINVSGMVTKQERDLIVKAMGLRPGRWFKCPNGHFYCIGECGGAMEKSKCPECGASIGGTNHQLLPDNSHAGEMDGSTFPAWSDMANMANYRF